MRILRVRDVIQLTGLSRTSIWRLENADDFPKRFTLLGGRVGWYEQEVRNWTRSRRNKSVKNKGITMTELLTIKEVADLIGWTEKQTKGALADDTSFPRPMTRSGRKYFDGDAVIEWADNNGIEIFSAEETNEEFDDDDE